MHKQGKHASNPPRLSLWPHPPPFHQTLTHLTFPDHAPMNTQTISITVIMEKSL